MARYPATLKNNRGQALIETLALSATILGAFSALGALAYLTLIHAGANYLLHELLVCQSTEGKTHCEQEFRQKTAAFLLHGRILRLESSQRRRKARVLLELPMGKTMEIHKEFGRPL